MYTEILIYSIIIYSLKILLFSNDFFPFWTQRYGYNEKQQTKYENPISFLRSNNDYFIRQFIHFLNILKGEKGDFELYEMKWRMTSNPKILTSVFFNLIILGSS